MANIYLIALNLEARDAEEPFDLVAYLKDRFGSREIKVIECGYDGAYITASMRESLSERIRKEVPFVTIEPASEMHLL